MGLFSGQRDIDLELERQLNELIEELDNYAEQGKAAEKSVTGFEKSLEAAKELEQETYSKLMIIESEIEDLKRQLAELTNKQANCSADLTARREDCVNLDEQLIDSNRVLDEMEISYKQTAEKVREGIQDWNLELHKHAKNNQSIRQFKKFQQPIQINQLCCLGDLHGWAPGLINSLKEIGHSVSILGQDLDEAAMEIRFPDPVRARNAGRDLPKVGLSNHPLRPNSSQTPFFDIDFTPSDNSQECLLIIGDMVDRGDHSELNLEIMRQIHITSPGSMISLMGNHEVWLIENAFEVWSANEERYRMQGRARVGTTIYDPIMSGHISLIESMESSFRILRGALGAYLLTQHFSVMEGLDKPSSKIFSKFYESTFKIISVKESKLQKAVLDGGWELHELGIQVLDEILQSSKDEPLPIPGAFSLIRIKENLFCHAEINGLLDDKVNVNNGLMSLDWCDQEITIKPTLIHDGNAVEAPLYFARSTDDEVELEDTVNTVRQQLPVVKRYIHGHTVHSTEPVKSVGEIEIINLDMGMTPCYRDLYHENPYNPNVLPYIFRVNLLD